MNTNQKCVTPSLGSYEWCKRFCSTNNVTYTKSKSAKVYALSGQYKHTFSES